MKNQAPSAESSLASVEAETAEHIARLLTRSSEQLNDNTTYALRRARETALQRQSAHQPVLALNAGSLLHRLLPHSSQQWLMRIALLTLFIVAGAYWNQAMNPDDVSHLDLAILTDDLPMEVFVDD